MSASDITVRPLFETNLIEAMTTRGMFGVDNETKGVFLAQMKNPASYATGSFEWSISPASRLVLRVYEGNLNAATFFDSSRYLGRAAH